MKQCLRILLILSTLSLFYSCERPPDPDKAEEYFNLGFEKFKSGVLEIAQGNIGKAQSDYKGAIKEYTRAIKYNPVYANAYHQRAVARCKLGDIESEHGTTEVAQKLYYEGITDRCKSLQLSNSDGKQTVLPSDFEKETASVVQIIGWKSVLKLNDFSADSGFSIVDENIFPAGSGFFVDKNRIATNIHVVSQSGPLFVKLGETGTLLTIDGVVAFDKDNDLVILKVAGEGTPLPLGNSEAVDRGDDLTALGYPNFVYKIGQGSLHSIRKTDEYLRIEKGVIAPGNSGGPVLNSDRQVIGISVKADKYYGYAIPSSILTELYNQSDLEEPLVAWRKRDHIQALTYQWQGQSYYHKGDYQKAIANYNAAINLDPNADDFYLDLGDARREHGNAQINNRPLENVQALYHAAIEDYERAIKLNPNNDQGYFKKGLTWGLLAESEDLLGNSERAQELYKKEKEEYEKGIVLDPYHTETYRFLGSVKSILAEFPVSQGNAEKAQALWCEIIQDYTKAIYLYPNDAKAYVLRGVTRYGLANSEAEHGNTEKAQELWHKVIQEDYTPAIRLNPNDALTYRLRANVKFRLTEYQAAIQDYTQTIVLNPKDAQAYYWRGQAEKALGRPEAAKADYEKAKKLDPDVGQ